MNEPSTKDAAAATMPSAPIDSSKPQDFDGEVATNNELPSQETLRKVEDYVVLDSHGQPHPFKSLYSGRNAARRVLIVFVRHFFCGVGRFRVDSGQSSQALGFC